MPNYIEGFNNIFPTDLTDKTKVAPTSYLEPHYTDEFNSWKTNANPQSTGALLRKVDPVINEALKSYGSSVYNSPTLKSKAKKLTIQSFSNYDPSRAKLRTHLLSQLQGLRRMAAREEQLVNIPEQVMLDAGHVREHENRLRDTLSRDPSDVELADASGLSVKRIGYVRSIRPAYSEGKLSTVDEEGSSMNVPGLERQSSPATERAWQDFIYSDLNPQDQVIMEHTLGLNSKKILSNQEIAKRLNLSPGAISQRKSRIQTLLDKKEETGLF